MPAIANPTNVHPPFGNYAHGFAVPAGARWVVTSGQLGISNLGIGDLGSINNRAIPDSVAAQAELCFDAIEAILKEAGMSLADVVQLRAYVTERAAFADYMAVRDRRLEGRRVASTLLVVGGFTREEFLIEVEATAARGA